MGFVWVHADSFLHSVASRFHSFVTAKQKQCAWICCRRHRRASCACLLLALLVRVCVNSWVLPKILYNCHCNIYICSNSCNKTTAVGFTSQTTGAQQHSIQGISDLTWARGCSIHDQGGPVHTGTHRKACILNVSYLHCHLHLQVNDL